MKSQARGSSGGIISSRIRISGEQELGVHDHRISAVLNLLWMLQKLLRTSFYIERRLDTVFHIA